MTSTNLSLNAPKLNSKVLGFIFVLTLVAFTSETQLAQNVQSEYHKPYLIFYIVHSSFLVIFPLHLLYLVTVQGHNSADLIRGLRQAVKKQLDPAASSDGFPSHQFFVLTLCLTIGVSMPGLLWFAAVSLAPLSDVTAIWNTNAFFAYLLSVKILGVKWQARRLAAVLLATIGVLVMVYGDTRSDEHGNTSHAASVPATRPSAPLVGDLLTLIASLGYAFYQVLYKKFAALPSDPELTHERAYEQIPSEDGTDMLSNRIDSEESVYPLPFALHPNMLTSIAGFFTFILLWLPVPVLHYLDIERFSLPPDGKTLLTISGIAASGVIFNAGFMILLGTWGPIITSVGGLLTIVLVFISDLMFGAGLSAINIWSVTGTIAVVSAFAILASDIFYSRAI